MLTHLEPHDRIEKMGKPQNIVNCRVFLGSAHRQGGSAAGRAALLSYGEERMPHGSATAMGALGPVRI